MPTRFENLPAKRNPRRFSPGLHLLAWRFAVLFGCLGGALPARASEDGAEPELLWQAAVPASRTDLSGSSELLNGRVPHNRLGGFSAIEYSGRDDVYWVLPDRGPQDGATDYQCRIQQIQILPDGRGGAAVEVLATMMLQKSPGVQFVGALTAQTSDSSLRGLAYDPEGVRVTREGRLLVSDEYGPYLDRFSPQGVLEASWTLPPEFRMTLAKDLQQARFGAVPNRGLEGLALMPGGKEMVAIFQGALVQDSTRRDDKPSGKYVRLLVFSALQPGLPVRQYAYPLENNDFGVSEILAVDETRLLVLERDGKPAAQSRCKAVYLIDLADATDISGMAALPPKDALPASIRPVAKGRYLDLLASRYALKELSGLEKVEGMTWGPQLPSGQRQLLICTDNDFDDSRDSWIFGFATGL